MIPLDGPRRQARLSTKVLVTWGLMLAAWVAHRAAPDTVSELLPLLIFGVSRLFLWPAFPGMGRRILVMFLAGQLFLFIPATAGIVSLIASLVWLVMTLGALVFLLINDFAHVYWRLQDLRRKAADPQ